MIVVPYADREKQRKYLKEWGANRTRSRQKTREERSEIARQTAEKRWEEKRQLEAMAAAVKEMGPIGVAISGRQLLDDVAPAPPAASTAEGELLRDTDTPIDDDFAPPPLRRKPFGPPPLPVADTGWFAPPSRARLMAGH